MNAVAHMATAPERRDRIAPSSGPALTRPMRQVLLIIQEHQARHGVAPTYEEIRRAMGYPTRSRVHGVIERLEQRGAIRRAPNRTRGIEVLRPIERLPDDAPTPAPKALREATRLMALQLFDKQIAALRAAQNKGGVVEIGAWTDARANLFELAGWTKP